MESSYNTGLNNVSSCKSLYATFYGGVEDEFRSLTAWGKKQLCRLVGGLWFVY